MQIIVHLKPNSSQNKIEPLAHNQYNVWVKEEPVEGEANEALIKLLADHFDVAKSLIKIIHGFSSKTKTLEIDKEERG